MTCRKKMIQLGIKRIFDLCVSITGVIVLFPIFVIISIAIVLTNPGPALFKQERIGLNGKNFQILKFRTMVMNAESLGDGIIVRSEFDSRITKIGRLLRKTSLDELPQLFNVIKGEMSIVGPRPPVIYHPYNGYENYSKRAKKRFQMRPGITGLAQVTRRNSVSWDERIEIDIEYVDKFSLFLDLKIIMKTFSSMLYAEEYACK